jgi:TolA-binding protein
MMEPLLCEQDRELERELLRAGRGVTMSPRAEARLLAALGVAGTAAVAGHAAGGILSKLSVAVAGKIGSAALALVITGAVTAGAWVAMREQPQDSAPASPAVAAQLPAPDEQRPASVAPIANVPSATPATAVQPVAAPGSAQVNLRSSSIPRDRVRPLAEELRHVEGASRALRAGDAAGALLRLDEYTKQFPRGRLKLEAEVLTIEALARSGNPTAASTRAKAFLQRYPQSPLSARIERYSR